MKDASRVGNRISPWTSTRVPERMHITPLIASELQVPVAAASQVLDHHGRGEPAIGSEPLSQPLVDRGQRTLLEYLAAVQRRDVQYDRQQARGTRRRTSVKSSVKKSAR